MQIKEKLKDNNGEFHILQEKVDQIKPTVIKK